MKENPEGSEMDKSFTTVKIIPLGNASASTLAKFAKELDDAFHYNNCVTNVRYVQLPTHIEIGINLKMIHEMHSLFDNPDVLFHMDFYDDVIDCITVDTRLYYDEFVCDVKSINAEKELFNIINKMRTYNKHVVFCATELDQYLNMFCKINKYPLMTSTFRILMNSFFKHIEYKQNEDGLSQVINEATVDMYNKQMKKATEEYKMNEKTLTNQNSETKETLKKIQELGDIINELKTLSDKCGVPIITATQQKNCDKIDNDDNYIKMDGEKAKFDGGAIRYTKTGKGRFDLIPGEVITEILMHAWESWYSNGDMTTSKFDLMCMAYYEGESRYIDTIINLVNLVYCDGEIVEDDNGMDSKEVSFDEFLIGFAKMLKDLAIHYENGAMKYGVDNWKKGIPVTGGDRGGSFTDSGLRHLDQYIMGLNDEPHHIACIWNFIGALWTKSQEDSIDDNAKNACDCCCDCCNCDDALDEDATLEDVLGKLPQAVLIEKETVKEIISKVIEEIFNR